MSETPESCTKSINEPCKLHPVDCPNCIRADVCQQSALMRAHPDKIKSCPGFRSRGQTTL